MTIISFPNSESDNTRRQFDQDGFRTVSVDNVQLSYVSSCYYFPTDDDASIENMS